jgi:sigma-B regulation protein RsbU (phosphoserine phosphatase)
MEDIKYMQCMEVWGGNRLVDSGVIMPGVDAWVYSQPCENQPAGGDVHFVSTCCGGKVVRMAVADISGHGERVAETGANLRMLLRRHINHPSQIALLRSLNREFTAATDLGVFATAVVMTFDGSKNRLVISNAGHPPPLWYQAKRRRWTLLQPQTAADAGGIPLGIDQDTSHQAFQLPLSVGDVILCYTDSLAEAKGPTGQMLGTDGLLRIVSHIGSVNASQLIPSLLAEIAKTDPAYGARDDVTCLAFRPNGLRPSVPLRDYLFAPFRLMLAGTGLKFGYAGWKREPWDAPIEGVGE